MNPLEEFVRTYKTYEEKKGIAIITATDLADLKSKGYTIEDFLKHITDRFHLLLHGSREDISGPDLKPNEEFNIFVTDLASIAIMRAIISNRGLRHPGLEYSFFIDEDNPLEVKIYGMNESTIGERGFVYVIGDRTGFKNDPEGSWQYVKGLFAPFIAKVEILREDFTYPIFDADKKEWTQ